MTESIWTLYRVRWDFLTQLCGQTPADPKIIKRWLESVQPNVKPPGARSMEEINEEVLDAITGGCGETETEYSKLVFARDHDGNLAMRGGTVKAHIKDCARVLSNQYVGKIRGERAFSTRVINGVYVDESKYWLTIYDQDTGQPKRNPDGEREKPIHVRGPRGEQQNAIKCFDYVLGARMEFILKVLSAKTKPKKGDDESEAKPSVALSDLHRIFQYGGVHGYAGERGDGEGRYVYEIEAIQEKKEKKRNAA